MGAISTSLRSQQISTSITLAISARAAAMRADGQDVISLGAGEPDFPTPEPIADAGVGAIRDGKTRYTAASGTPQLRKAAAKWFERFDLHYAPDEVMATAGAKPALTMALMALVNEGDRVLLPTPYWPSYPEMVKMVGGVPVDVTPSDGLIPTREDLENAAREHDAKGVMINFPNNPSGAVPTGDQIEAMVDGADATGMWIMSDEIYARLVYDDNVHVSPASFEKGRDRTIVVNGGTKSHSMTGWRIGFLAGPKDVIAAAARLQSQAIGNPCSISQEAALEVCNEADDSEFERRKAAFDERRQFLHEAINAIPGLKLDRPQGAFYALVDAREACAARGIDDVALTEQLLVEALVAAVPGTAFAFPGFLRLSYAASMDDLEKAVDRIRGFLSK